MFFRLILLNIFLVDAGMNYLLNKGASATHRSIHEINTKLKGMMSNYTINNLKTGVLLNGEKSLVNNNYDELSFKHTVSVINQSNKVDSKIHTTKFQIGVPSSKTLYDFSSDKLVDLKVLVDTERDYLSTEKRSNLTNTFGFNQRSYDFLLTDTFMRVKDYKFLYQSHENKFKTRLANKNIYGCIFYERLKLSIKSETDYYSLLFKLHLCKITNPSVDVQQLVENTFNLDLNVNSSFKVPVSRQLSVPKKHGSFRYNTLTDLKCTLSNSDWFKDNAKVLKTFQKVLGPSDIWNFDYCLHYGPGILLNRIYDQKDIFDDHPVGYFFILQAEGDPRASVTRNEDGQNFNGSGPGRFNYTFQKELKFTKQPEVSKEVLLVREFVKNDEDFEDQSFQDYFTPDRSSKINILYSNINVNRIEDNSIDYQLRYGEGRLTVYMDASLRNWIAKNSLNDKNLENEVDNLDQTNSTLKSGVLDPDSPILRGSSSDSPGLRGVSLSDIDQND